MSWIEVANNVFVKSYGADQVNIAAIIGSSGITVVDTGGSPAEARAIVDELTQRFGKPIVGAINTHSHYDHCFGNSVFADLGMPIIGHHQIPAHFESFEAPRLQAWRKDPSREPDKAWDQVVLVHPSVLVEQPTTLAAGGREILCLPISRGHTDTDLAVFVPDARAWMLGDVIEEVGPPMFGSGSWPLHWPESLRTLLLEISAADVIVPGHGKAVDLLFATTQAASLQAVADAVRKAWSAGSGIDEAIAESELPWPHWMLRSAFERGYSELSAEH
ncbi:MBL fold metallo-hydrolase [Glutamicibacter arilaitensis]|uniref:MBL fold metallo-hydrolase n=1 Tax=Glutamicibacter arilaitensis TaxID=256701 RepID=UPI00384BE18C